MKALARRKCLREHFERIHCRGLIKDVAFTGPFGTVAQGSPNFLVATAGIPGLPPLPEEIGMSNLERLCRCMEIELDDTVSIDVSLSHLLFRDSQAQVRLVQCSASYVRTRVARETAASVMNLSPDPDWWPLSADLTRWLGRGTGILRAERLSISVIPDGATFALSGQEQSFTLDTTHFSGPSGKSAFDARLVSAVVRSLTNVTDAQFALDTKAGVMLIRQGYQILYMISEHPFGGESTEGVQHPQLIPKAYTLYVPWSTEG